MRDPDLPLTQELVLIGGGHAHALVLRMWAMTPLPGARLTVINPDPAAPYTGMLPGLVAGHYRQDELMIDLVRLCRRAGARLILDRATGLDTAARRVTLAGGRHIPYHVASLDIGITSELPDLPGMGRHAVAAKPLGAFAQAWAGFRAAVRDGRLPPRAAVLGGGVGGAELALAMAHALRADAASAPVGVTLIDSGEILPALAAPTRALLLGSLGGAGIALMEGQKATAVGPEGLTLATGQQVAATFVATATGARPQGWLAETGLMLKQGFVVVGSDLRALDHDDIFAVGDCAHMDHAPRPKAGVFAVRQAPVLFHNLRAALAGSEAMHPFRPQRDYLKLISTGGKTAIADKWGLRLKGPRLWRLKDRIDRRFMAQFHDAPPMPVPPLPAQHAQGLAEALGSKPLCGGCGSKVGGRALSGALATLPAIERPDIRSVPGDDAAILAGPGGADQVITTDHLRAFTADPAVMARIAANHALGDIWAMGARPQAALAQIILPRLSAELQQDWLAEIMGAAAQVLGDAGAPIVGGHSSLGAELTIGFTVTGLVSKGGAIRHDGARPGDIMVLTRPIGSGVIMAAEMEGRAAGADVAAALARMQQPQGKQAALLATRANAMTDVTGFGLAGHVLNICAASGLGAALELEAVPLMDGALELAAAAMRSSIFGANRALWSDAPAIADPRLDLLFDPQTAGGLLAAVPAAELAGLQKDFKAIGADLHVIGLFETGGGLRLV